MSCMVASRNHMCLIASMLYSCPWTYQGNQRLIEQIAHVGADDEWEPTKAAERIARKWWQANYMAHAGRYPEDPTDLIDSLEWCEQTGTTVTMADCVFDAWRKTDEQRGQIAHMLKALDFLIHQCEEHVPAGYENLHAEAMSQMQKARKVLADYIIETMPAYNEAPWGIA